METCLKAALVKRGGEVVKLERTDERGVPVYEFDILGQDGKEVEMEVDAASEKKKTNFIKSARNESIGLLSRTAANNFQLDRHPQGSLAGKDGGQSHGDPREDRINCVLSGRQPSVTARFWLG